MKTMVIVAIVSLLALVARAQNAIEAYANGEDTYLRFTQEPYDSSKRYTLIQFFPGGPRACAAAEQSAAVDVVICDGPSEDLIKTLATYRIQASITAADRLRLDGPGYTLNTTSACAYLVLLDEKPQLLCCGAGCDDRLSAFFTLDKS